MMTLAEVAVWTGGRVRGQARLEGVSTDTRRLEPGALFVALRGPRFDGHHFLEKARAGGAAGVLVERGTRTGELPAVEVAETGRALLELAGAWRRGRPARVVAVTGSCGKTTVKDLIARVLREAAEGAALATPGNLNNTVGVPLTLFGLRDHHRFAAVEVGINRRGEMEGLAAAVGPDVAVITNAAPAHLEGLGSVEAVAAEKGRLLAGLGREGVAVLNADSPFAEAWARAAPGPVLRFGLEARADVRGEWEPRGDGGRLWIRTPHGETSVDLPLPGRHSAANALAAAAAAEALGVPAEAIGRGLAAAEGPPGRLQVRSAKGEISLLDDTYNANPASLEAALAVLTEGAGCTWLVLGAMGELGSEAGRWHRWAGELARTAGVDRLLTVGPLAEEALRGFGAGGRALPDWEAAAVLLGQEAGSGDRILVKGSRAARLERLVTHLAGDS